MRNERITNETISPKGIAALESNTRLSSLVTDGNDGPNSISQRPRDIAKQFMNAVCKNQNLQFCEKPLKKLQSTKSKITFSADRVESSPSNQQSTLKGNVNLTINNKIKIIADDVLVNFTNSKEQAAELIIHGNGILQERNQSSRFVNGIFDPATLQFSAEKIEYRKY